MDVINQKTKKTLFRKVRICESPPAKAWGLMFSKKREEFCLLFVFERPETPHLHMWFVFYPIDVVFLDDGGKVVEIKEDFRPFSTHSTSHACRYFLEIPAGSVKKRGIRTGMRLSWQNI